MLVLAMEFSRNARRLQNATVQGVGEEDATACNGGVTPSKRNRGAWLEPLVQRGGSYTCDAFGRGQAPKPVINWEFLSRDVRGSNSLERR